MRRACSSRQLWLVRRRNILSGQFIANFSRRSTGLGVQLAAEYGDTMVIYEQCRGPVSTESMQVHKCLITRLAKRIQAQKLFGIWNRRREITRVFKRRYELPEYVGV